MRDSSKKIEPRQLNNDKMMKRGTCRRWRQLQDNFNSRPRSFAPKLVQTVLNRKTRWLLQAKRRKIRKMNETLPVVVIMETVEKMAEEAVLKILIFPMMVAIDLWFEELF